MVFQRYTGWLINSAGEGPRQSEICWSERGYLHPSRSTRWVQSSFYLLNSCTVLLNAYQNLSTFLTSTTAVPRTVILVQASQQCLYLSCGCSCIKYITNSSRLGGGKLHIQLAVSDVAYSPKKRPSYHLHVARTSKYIILGIAMILPRLITSVMWSISTRL